MTGCSNCERAETVAPRLAPETPPSAGAGRPNLDDNTLFAEQALVLFSHAAMLLHWRPDDFWAATPAELAAILSPASGTSAAPDLAALMARFPDAPNPSENRHG